MSVDMKATTFVFPHETLTPIDGKPTHESVTLLRKELYANAYDNECSLGGGDNGYLGIIMPHDEYITLQRDAGIADADIVPFIKPPTPDPTDAANIIIRTNKQILDYKAMEAHLKRQLLEAITDKDYITVMDDAKVGFSGTTVKTLLDYIVSKYDVITYDQLNSNREKLDENWDPSEPIYCERDAEGTLR